MSHPRDPMMGTILAVLAAAMTLGVTVVAGAGIVADENDAASKAARGEPLFDVYCTSCHGQDARGDGPVAPELVVKPGDLTRIAERNGGEFPFEVVRRKIDGREDVAEHTPRQMPLWGIALQQWDRDTNQEEEVQRRIDLLTHYLASIQASGD